MLHVTLAGLSEDNRRLLLVSDVGEQFSLVIDARLRAALRGEHARFGQLEIHMDSALRPRDIQARIRAGESPDAVALAAQTSIDKILPYANPVLAERAHVASRAQRSSVRRKAGETVGGARTLGDAVAAMLRAQNVDPAQVEWDAWRREDGRWALVGVFDAPKRRGTAKFTFDAPGNFVTLDNEDAKWLVGETVAKAAPKAKDDLQKARQRRLYSVPEDELPLGDQPDPEPSHEASHELGDDALDLVNEDPSHTAPGLEAPSADEPDGAVARDETAETPLANEPAEPVEPAAPRPAKRKGRASVPSWDEIMFGGGKQD